MNQPTAYVRVSDVMVPRRNRRGLGVRLYRSPGQDAAGRDRDDRGAVGTAKPLLNSAPAVYLPS